MKKEKNNKLKKAFSKMKKPLMIFSIILNILFGLALVIGLSSKPKAQIVKADENVSYNLRGVTFHCKSYDNWTSQGLSQVSTSSPIRLNFYPTFTLGNYSITKNYFHILRVNTNNINTGVNGGLYWQIKDSSTGTSSYPFVMMNFDSSHFGDFYYKTSSSSDSLVSLDRSTEFTISFPDDADYISEDAFKLLSLNSSSIDNDPNAPVEPVEPSETENDIIYLGDNFNPVTYITQNGEYILNGFAGKHTGLSTGYLDFTGLTFKSNGQEFNRIRFSIGNIPAIAPIVTQDGQIYIDLSSGYNDYICCFGMSYQYLNSNNDVEKSVQVISYRRTIIDDNGVGIKAYDVRSPYIIWLNNEYRTLEVLDDDESVQSSSYLTINGMTTKQLLQVTSSVNTNVMGLTDVFGLLKGAFAGITGILAISILPGITLGLLLFIPLIVTIIIAVVRLIKK